jgi:hypothetical protein
MSTVLVGAYAADPSTIWPEKYSSCFWNFTTGWTCETIETAPEEPTPLSPQQPQQPLGNTPDPNANPIMLPVSGVAAGGGCCGRCGGGSVSSPTTGVPIAGAVSATGKNCACKCGYTNREAMLAVAVALVFFLLVRK